MADETKPPVMANQLPNFEPFVTEIPLGWEFGYIEADKACPTIQIKNLNKDRYGNLVGELTAYCLDTDIMTPVTGIKFNFSNLSSRKRTAQGIKEAYLDVHNTWIDWNHILNDICWRVTKLYKNGHEVEEIWPTEDILKPQFLLDPLLPLNQPTIIFGDGGSGKGHVALVACLLTQLPFADNKLGLTTLNKPTNALYLDYEADKSDFERTLTGICNGFDINIGIKRLGIQQPLVECIESLRGEISQNNIGFLIIDSLGLAAGGDINSAESANKFWAALKTIPDITTLIIAHNSKDPLNKTKSIFGSVFFTNLARSVWEIKKDQDEDSSDMTVALKNTKNNRMRQLPIGIRYSFNNETGCITTTRVDLSDTGLSSELPLYKQIERLLLSGSMTKADMARALGKSEPEIIPTLYKYKKLFINLDGGHTWGVVAKGSNYSDEK